jgi:uncharacterized protein
MSQPDTHETIGARGDAVPHAFADGAGSRYAVLLRMAAVVVVTFGAGLAGGLIARYVGIPLPFILGPLSVVGAGGLFGLPVHAIRRVRPVGQFVTGSAVGTQFTPIVMLKLISLLPVIIGVSVLSIVVCAFAALVLMRLVSIDAKSAFFATMPAGAAEMANIAARYGGAIEPITVAQTMRVALTVSAAPFMVIHFATDGTLHPVIAADLLPWASIGLLVVTALAGGAVLARVRFPNSWFLGALLGAALLGGFGVVHGRVPDWLLIVAQVIIGCSLGAQFRQEFITRLLHTMLASVVTVLFSGCTMALVAAAFAYALGYPVPTMVLAFAPAGMAEMTLTGKVLGLDAALIASFHVLRVIMVLTLCVPGFRLFERLTSGRRGGT